MLTDVLLLSRRSVRELLRSPAALLPELFIPLFFLVVQVGQVSKTFPRHTPFLHGQPYVGFQLPVSLIFAVSSASSGLSLVTDIDLGYFDKLLLTPVRRTALVFGRLTADLVRGLAVATLVLGTGLALGARIRSGPAGAVLLVVLTALWGVAYAGIAQLIALRTKSVRTTQSSFIVFFPLLFLTPNFVPLNRLSGPLQAIARGNPVTYVIEGLRSLVLTGFNQPGAVLAGLGVTVAVGAVLTGLSLRALRHFAD